MKFMRKFVLFFSLICVNYLFLTIVSINRDNSINYLNITMPPPEKRDLNLNNGGKNRSLILVHGHGSNSYVYSDWMNPSDYDNYYNNVVAINYYWNGVDPKPIKYIGDNKVITVENNISDIVDCFFLFLNSSNFTDIDFVCHSMGGIVVRGLICNYYNNLTDKGINIDDVITMGTPNQGSLYFAHWAGSHPNQIIIDFLKFLIIYLITEDLGASIFSVLLTRIIPPLSNQLYQIRMNSPYLETLNVAGDETPYNINWTTIAGRIPSGIMLYLLHLQQDVNLAEYDEWDRQGNIFLLILMHQFFYWCDIGSDGLISPNSVKLEGAENYIWAFITHRLLLEPGSAKKNFIIDILTEIL